jgi:hypothetical protein
MWVLVQPDRGIAMDRLTCQLIVTCRGLYCHTRSYNQWWLKCTASVFDFGEYCSDSPCAYGTTYAVSRVSILQFNFGKIFPPWTSTCPLPFGRLVCGRKVQSLRNITRQQGGCSLGAHLKYLPRPLILNYELES